MTTLRLPPLASPDATPVAYLTKWDYCGPRLRASLDRTSFNGTCSGCGLVLETEGEFARHFFITNTRHLNLGHCPSNGKTAMRLPTETCDGCGDHAAHRDHYREDDRGYLRPLCYHCESLIARFTPTA